MKRFITAVILFVLAWSICIFGKITTNKQTERITDTMNSIEEQIIAGNTDEAIRISTAFQEEWESMHSSLCLFLQHEHLDPLESAFAVLPYYIELGDWDIARTECQLVRTMTEHIVKTESVSLDNIL